MPFTSCNIRWMPVWSSEISRSTRMHNLVRQKARFFDFDVILRSDSVRTVHLCLTALRAQKGARKSEPSRPELKDEA